MPQFTRTCCLVALILPLAVTTYAQDPVVQIIPAKAVTTPPKIDGILDDECWKDLPEYTGFMDKPTRHLVDRQTTAKICYDKDNIYVAFHAFHPDPKHIMAVQTKRNGDLVGEDYVTICIDSQHQHRDDSTFRVNAIGTMVEALQRSATDNIEFKGDWQGAAKIVDDGYTAEMAIPFSLLVYKNHCDTFGICFGRRIPEEQLTSIWPDLNGVDDLRFYADLKGIEPPIVTPKPKTLGYVLGTAGGGGNSRVYRGFDMRYPFSNDMAGVLSIKPDFSSVEQNVQSINFSYTERYQSDYRPFFKEWEFPIDNKVFYSMRVPEFDAGVKLAGNAGPNSFGLLNAATLDHRNDTVVGYRKNIGDVSFLSFNLANHSIPGHNNTVSYYSGRLQRMRGQRSYRLAGGLYDSATTGAPDGGGKWVSCSTRGGDGALCAAVGYEDYDSSFNSEIGYLPEVGVKGPYIDLWRNKTYQNRRVRSAYYGFDASTLDNQNNALYSDYWSVYGEADMINGRNYTWRYAREQRAQSLDVTPGLGILWNVDKMNKGGRCDIAWGRVSNGNHRYISLEQKFNLNGKMVVGLHASRESIGKPSDNAGTTRQVWATVNYDISDERGIGGRILKQSGKTNVFLMFRQQVRSGTDAFIIFGDPNVNETVSKVSMKLARVL